MQKISFQFIYFAFFFPCEWSWNYSQPFVQIQMMLIVVHQLVK